MNLEVENSTAVSSYTAPYYVWTLPPQPEAAHLQKAGLDLPKSVAERTMKEHRHRQFLNATPKTDKVQ